MALIFKHHPGLVVYVTCGDPDISTTKEVVLAAAGAGADVIELGVPFSDPVADGPVIQAASQRALEHGTKLEDVLRLAGEVRQQSDVGLVVFSYLNPIVRYGMERFCAAARHAGVDGALITDLPLEEAGEYVAAMRAHELDTIFLAAPTSPDERLKRIAELSTGFIYAVSRTGVTGARSELSQDAGALVKRIKTHTKLPVAVGFGVSTAEHFAAVGQFADAAVVGSAIVKTVESAGREDAAAAVANFVHNFREPVAVQGKS